MKRALCIPLLLLCGTMRLASLPSEEKFPPIETVQLNDHLYKMTSTGDYRVNLVASIGPDGLLLVDTGLPSTGDALIKALADLKAGAPRIIINTHEHIDHTGNNARFEHVPVIIGHKNLRYRLRNGYTALLDLPESSLPNLALDGVATLRFNGEEISIFPIEGAHTDNDLGVYFRGSGIAYLGDLGYGMHFPSYDRFSGDLLLYGEAVRKALDFLPDSARVVSGHGRDCTVREMREFDRMLFVTIECVRSSVAAGKTLEQMKEQRLFEEWESFAGGESGLTPDLWMTDLFNRVKNGMLHGEPLYGLLYAAYKEKGMDGLLSKYAELKSGSRDRFAFDARTLGLIGNKLEERGRMEDAVRLELLNTQEFPGSYSSWYWLGEAYLKAGERERAAEALKRSLTLAPQDPEVQKLLQQVVTGAAIRNE